MFHLRRRKYGLPVPVSRRSLEPDEPHIRFYRPGGAYEIFTEPLRRFDMERLAGEPLTVRYTSPASLDACYTDHPGARLSCSWLNTEYRGPVFLGRYDAGILYPADARWFKAINDSLAGHLLCWRPWR